MKAIVVVVVVVVGVGVVVAIAYYCGGEGGGEFTGPENDRPKIFNNCKMQDPENDGLRARCMPRIHQTGVLF